MPRRLGTVTGAAGLAAINLLVVAGDDGPLRAAIGFPVAVLLPGAVAMRAMRLDRVAGWSWLLRAVALSIAGLLAVGLGLGVLPGAALSGAGSLIGLDLLVAVPAVAVAVRNRRRTARSTVDEFRTGRTPESTVDGSGTGPAGRLRLALAATARLVYAPGRALVLAALAVVGTAVGAARLDDGRSAAVTIAALACAAVAVVPAARWARRPGGETIAGGGLYLIGLAVLLATSLRGAGVTGHDIKIEYRVFLDTFATGSWSPGGGNVSYASCLSITVLPTFLARLLGIAPLDVFAVCFPLLFALVPVGVFLIARHVLPPAQAIVAGALFVAFPTFVNDMTMLDRQQIAMVFFTVAVLTLVGEPPSRRRTGLLAVLAVGVTVSHYTTSYVAAALMLIAWAVLTVPASIRRGRAVFRTGLGAAGALLLVLAAAWAAFTGNGAIVGDTVGKAATAVGAGAAAQSDATSYSLVGGGRPRTDQEMLDEYQAGLRSGAAAVAAPAGPDCATRLLPADVLPDAAAGAALARLGVDPGTANSMLRTAAVVLYQGGAVVGAALLWWRSVARVRRRPPGRPDRPVLAALAAASLLLLAGAVAAPQLSDDYGPLRLFQQALTVLAIPVVLAVATVLHRLSPVTTDRVAVGVAVGCLLTTSGVVPQLTGGYPPQLNLNNSGAYYRAYYTEASDLRTSRWLDSRLSRDAVIVADSRDSTNLRGLTRLWPRPGLVPGAVPAFASVLVTTADGRSATATAVVGDRVLRYEFPLACVAAGRRLLHADGVHRVYGPAALPNHPQSTGER